MCLVRQYLFSHGLLEQDLICIGRKLIFSLLFYLIFILIPCAFSENKTINFVFPEPNPTTVTIAVGDKVTWLGVSDFHPLQQVDGANSDTAVNGGFSSTDSPFSYRFDVAGTYYYRCTNHGVAATGGQMRGSVIVEESNGSTPTPIPTTTEDPTNSCDEIPSKPVLLLPANNSTSSKSRVLLDWENNSCVNSFKVVVRLGTKSGKIVDKKTVTESKYKTVKLQKKNAYFWSVKACKTSSCSKAETFGFKLQ